MSHTYSDTGFAEHKTGAFSTVCAYCKSDVLIEQHINQSMNGCQHSVLGSMQLDFNSSEDELHTLGLLKLDKAVVLLGEEQRDVAGGPSAKDCVVSLCFEQCD